MIIEIDGYFAQAYLKADRDYSLDELSSLYARLSSKAASVHDLAIMFCETSRMIPIEGTSELKPDVVMDTDTDRIYKPRYS